MTMAPGIYIAALALLAAAAGLAALWQRRKAGNLGRQLDYIHEKLGMIIDRKTNERLLLFSEEPEMRRLLTDINRLLDHNHSGNVERARLEQSLRRMLANVSHDLKTPLTVILGYIEMLERGGENGIPEEEHLRMLGMIHRKAEEVIALMNRFFDLAKLEAGDTELPLSRTELNEAGRRGILAFYELLESRGLRVEIEIPEEPYYCLANAEALDRVLANLLSNAIAYGSDGGVVGLRVYAREKQVCAVVWDRGKGIPASEQNRIFERLYTLEDSRNRGYQGSGLGLAITKRLTEQMGGSLSVDSVPGQGAAFTAAFPRMRERL
ncbi:sensor histidine kinase [Paenibacillus glufosinatiresistens]|uniref:sensor histidine kinase n=1 Tax=Paenibacillus glufosinatiresistens TaxID=3070657 RepID=UPI00286D6C35|nr:HAMP domain-containing sensor histidine kinase [Paenibacillus sp. YX.27]